MPQKNRPGGGFRRRSEIVEVDGAQLRICGLQGPLTEHDRAVLREFVEHERDHVEAGGLEEKFDPAWHELGEAGA